MQNKNTVNMNEVVDLMSSSLHNNNHQYQHHLKLLTNLSIEYHET